MVADDMKILVASGKEDVGNGHTNGSRRRRGRDDAEDTTQIA